MTDQPINQSTDQPAPERTLLIISQVYVPDPAAVGQYLADVARDMAGRGWRVIVLASNRGYDDPAQRYPKRETRDGAHIRRLPWSHFGKASIPVRLLGAAAFLVQVILRGLFTPRLRRILVSTSPPIAPLAALAISLVRRVPIQYWAMDLNPDQMVVLGRARPGSLPVRLFDAMNRAILRRAAHVVTLDRFMAGRLRAKRDIGDRLVVLPVWSQDDHLSPVEHQDNPFRREHSLEGRFVFMYSGNMSLASPLDTLVQAALKLQDEPDLVFMFIGGGLGRRVIEQAVDEHRPANVRLLPYQPLEQLRYSLSAADVHMVSVGPAIVGVCHPSKVYGAMAVSRPILLLGPDPCHVSDILVEHGIGWRIDHGDVEGAVNTVRRIMRTDRAELAAMGARARALVQERFSKARLGGAFCDLLEGGA